MATTIPANLATDDVLPESWVDDVVTAVTDLRDRERCMKIEFMDGMYGITVWNTRYITRAITTNGYAYATWAMPENMAGLTAVYLLYGGYTTASGTIDVVVYYAGNDEPHNMHAATSNNIPISHTADDVYKLDITGSLFGALSAGDIVGFRVMADDINLQLFGLLIEYTAD